MKTITAEEFIRMREGAPRETNERKRHRDEQEETVREERSEQDTVEGPTKTAKKEAQGIEQGQKRERPENVEAEERKNAIRIISALINGEYYDDVSGKKLVNEEAAKARRKEIEYFRKMQVYKNVQRAQVDGKVISVRWADANKGDDEDPK